MFKKNISFIKAFNRNKNPTETPITTGYMFNKIQKKFKDCIQPAIRKSNPICELMRIHYVDIRSTWDIKDDASMYTEDIGLTLLRSLFRTGVRLKKNQEEIMDVVKRVNSHNNVILNMLKILIKGNKINLLDVFCKNKLLKKELNSSYKKEEIVRFLKAMSHKKVGNITLFISGIKSLISSIENNTEVNLNFIKKSESVFLKLNSLLLDCYCMSRIFKFHNVKKNKNKEEFQPVESKNIIIYVGNAHARNMVEFLRFIGFKPTYSYYEPNEKGCVNMKKQNTYLPKKSPVIFNHKTQQNTPSSRINQTALKKLRIIELVDIAKQLGCKGYSKMKKTDLIDLIMKSKKIQSPVKQQVKSPVKQQVKSPVKQQVKSPVKPQLQPPIKPQMNNPLYLNKLTVVQLRNFAKKIHLKGYSKLNKSDLIEFIISMQE
jgi:hypothetical protein